MRSISHLPGVWSMISFDYGRSPGTGIVPFSTYQTKSCKRVSNLQHSTYLRTDGGTTMGSEMDSTRLLITSCPCSLLFARSAHVPCDNFNDEKQRPRSKTQQLLCLHSLVNVVMGRLFLTGRSTAVTPVGSHFGSDVTKLVL